MIGAIGLGLGALGALSAIGKHTSYRPVTETSSTFGALTDIAGAGLGGFLGGSSLAGGGLGGLGAAGGILGGLGGNSGVNTAALPQTQSGAPRFIPAAQLPQLGGGGGLGGLASGFLPGESGGIPDILAPLIQAQAQQAQEQQALQLFSSLLGMGR